MTAPLILFGGTFDPVHRAHISGARAVSRLFGNAPVEMLPNAVPPHRPQPGASADHRLAMLQAACEPWPALHVNDWELRQAGPSWTRLTLEHFRHQIGDRPLLLVIGADSLATFHLWRDWQALPALCHLVVLPRPGAGAPDKAVCEAFPEADADALTQLPAGRRLMLARPLLDVSATAVRQALAEKGDCPALDQPVLSHIRRHGLYNVAQDQSASAAGETRNHDGTA